MAEATAAELARRYGVARSTVKRALTGVVEPVNPGEPQLRWCVDEVDAFWPTRARKGRPRKHRDEEQR